MKFEPCFAKHRKYAMDLRIVLEHTMDMNLQIYASKSLSDLIDFSLTPPVSPIPLNRNHCFFSLLNIQLHIAPRQNTYVAYVWFIIIIFVYEMNRGRYSRILHWKLPSRIISFWSENMLSGYEIVIRLLFFRFINELSIIMLYTHVHISFKCCTHMAPEIEVYINLILTESIMTWLRA